MTRPTYRAVIVFSPTPSPQPIYHLRLRMLYALGRGVRGYDSCFPTDRPIPIPIPICDRRGYGSAET